MAHHRDPALHTAIWDYRDGAISRRRLLTHPAFAAAMNQDASRLGAALGEHGLTPERMRERLVAELTAAGAYPPVEGEPDVVASEIERPSAGA